ncbi:hypothetical protein NP493_892g01063 [Ridgeia piscesae]|uniref:Transmembrane protein 120A n=1 Tax=Ridgeia piscesae TaxID=27915 RepID=A0AAD9KL60_RIDPI|nr:hypothetical protein NP493_892g01063 [Ridgeia piscesae]
MTCSVSSCLEDWADLEKEFGQLEEQHRVYCRKVDEVKEIQKKCTSNIAHQRYCMRQVAADIKILRRRKDLNSEELNELNQLEQNIRDKKKQYHELEDVLPHENGYYLKVILGSVNVSLLSKVDKFKYKEDYEMFKLYITLITIVLGCLLWLFPYRVTDAFFQFLLVWYYCTLTIREHILKVNGSRIKGWWILHHFISTACAGILLIWPDGYTYDQFRDQFFLFCIYMSVVQLVKYYYQRGMLYRLRSLGERRNMDITVEGFQSFMWKGLTFVLPFLVGGYVYVLSCAVCVTCTCELVSCYVQVYVLSYVFFVLFLGNSLTLVAVLRQKIKEHASRFMLENKYRFNYKTE